MAVMARPYIPSWRPDGDFYIRHACGRCQGDFYVYALWNTPYDWEWNPKWRLCPWCRGECSAAEQQRANDNLQQLKETA